MTLRTASAAFILCFAAPASADVSSWLFAGGGASNVERQGAPATTVPALTLDAGMGTSARHFLAVGGLLRLNAQFTHGVSYALALRTATRGYNQGTFGLAIDLGGYLKAWGDGEPGLTGGLALGGPWGTTLNLMAEMGPSDYRVYSAVLGVDLARLTVYRSMGLNWWPNPYPTPRAEHGARLE